VALPHDQVVSVHTVEWRLQNAYRKIGVRNRANAAAYMVRSQVDGQRPAEPPTAAPAPRQQQPELRKPANTTTEPRVQYGDSSQEVRTVHSVPAMTFRPMQDEPRSQGIERQHSEFCTGGPSARQASPRSPAATECPGCRCFPSARRSRNFRTCPSEDRGPRSVSRSGGCPYSPLAGFRKDGRPSCRNPRRRIERLPPCESPEMTS
jgi:hypothetical protein